ncbi:hypothetical protein P9112_008871 [Eukaryota sp. TZLM1-RC]
MLWLTQFRVLLWKNFLELKRSWFSLSLRTILPILILVVYVLNQSSTGLSSYLDFSQQGKTVKHPPSHPISQDFPTCERPCLTLAVAPDDQIIRDLVQELMDTQGQSLSNVHFLPSYDDLSLFLFNGSSNPVLAGLHFTPDHDARTLEAVVQVNTSTYPTCHYSGDGSLASGGVALDPCHELFTNVVYPLHSSLQAAFLSFSTQKQWDLDLSFAFSPHPVIGSVSSTSDGAGVLSYYLVFMILLLSWLIIEEKKNSMRAHLIQSGLHDSAYWASWGLTIFIIFFICFVLVLICGFVLNFTLLTVNDFSLAIYVSFHLLFFVTTAILLTSSLVNSPTGWAGISVLFLLFSSIFSNLVPFLLEIPLRNSVFWSYLVLLFPPSLIFTVLNTLSFTAGEEIGGIGIDDISKICPMSSFGPDFPCKFFLSDYLFLMRLFCLVYVGLALYIATVFPKRSGGPFGDPLLVFNYFLEKFRSNRRVLTAQNDRHTSSSDPDIASLAHKSYDFDRNVISVSLLSRFFRYGFLWLNKTKAINGVSFGVQKNVTTALIGQNGSGKSTLLNVLLGEFSPSKGIAFVFEKNVITQKRLIRSKTNVIPQFDCVYSELTAFENMIFLGRIRGLSVSDCLEQSRHLFELIGLDDVANRRVSTYSGGMVRRLSVALGFLGSASLVLADEMSTGLSPTDKQKVWNLLQKEKEKRTVLIIEHDLLSADMLCDSIIMMHKGHVIASGTPLHLKSRFGSGVMVSASVNDDTFDKVVNVMKFFGPIVKLEGMLQVKVEGVQEAQNLLERLENEGINDILIDMSTMNDVFMKAIAEFSKQTHH